MDDVKFGMSLKSRLTRMPGLDKQVGVSTPVNRAISVP